MAPPVTSTLENRPPKHIRFAQALALVSGATVVLATGAALLTTGCSYGCSGICGYVPPPRDASYARDTATADHPVERDAASFDGRPGDAGAGGGPMAAPPLPPDWFA